MNLSNKNLTSLDGIDLTGVTDLICDNNMLTFLPCLPDSLKLLSCQGNKMISLPQLPDSLMALQCNNNNLSSLPILPDSLQTLWCWDNNFSETHLFKIRLNQHNEMRRDLNLPIVDVITNGKEIKEQWSIWQYRVDGEKYKRAEKEYCEN